jgi:hypothetical protein
MRLFAVLVGLLLVSYIVTPVLGAIIIIPHSGGYDGLDAWPWYTPQPGGFSWLNPQPEPPMFPYSNGGLTWLNPQPEPPLPFSPGPYNAQAGAWSWLNSLDGSPGVGGNRGNPAS